MQEKPKLNAPERNLNERNIAGYIKNCYKNYWNFEGRASRPEFWYFTFYIVLVYLFLYLLMWMGYLAYYQNINRGAEGLEIIAPTLLAVAAIAFWLVNIIPHIAVTTRRLHDTSRSGWYYFINLIPYVGVCIVAVLLLFAGDKEDNKYGPKPN